MTKYFKEVSEQEGEWEFVGASAFSADECIPIRRIPPRAQTNAEIARGITCESSGFEEQTKHTLDAVDAKIAAAVEPLQQQIERATLEAGRSEGQGIGLKARLDDVEQRLEKLEEFRRNFK